MQSAFKLSSVCLHACTNQRGLQSFKQNHHFYSNSSYVWLDGIVMVFLLLPFKNLFLSSITHTSTHTSWQAHTHTHTHAITHIHSLLPGTLNTAHSPTRSRHFPFSIAKCNKCVPPFSLLPGKILSSDTKK